MPRRITAGSEQDTYTNWRHTLCYLQRPGIMKKIKRTTHKRERRDALRTIQEQM